VLLSLYIVLNKQKLTMLCPFCREKDTSVVDSRPTEDGTAIRRRRVCLCGGGQRFTTFERVQFRELTVLKKNGRRSPFDREKLAKSLFMALKKRPIDDATTEKLVTKISRELEEMGQSEIQSSVIGKIVMEQLKELDKIAYIRFASVYTNFKEVKEFEEYIEKLDGKK
jgi:transcriptional repressor NrdR